MPQSGGRDRLFGGVCGRFGSRLRTRLAELDARLHGTEAELDCPEDEERATEREVDEVQEDLGRSASTRSA